MSNKPFFRAKIRDELDAIAGHINAALIGRDVSKLENTLKRIGRGGSLPHWYERLRAESALPNLDGKTIGSIVEMLLVGVLENYTFDGLEDAPILGVNPARGVDLPDLDLGVKSHPRTTVRVSRIFQPMNGCLVVSMMSSYSLRTIRTRRRTRRYVFS